MRHPREARDNHAKRHPAGATDTRRMGRSGVRKVCRTCLHCSWKDFCYERGVWRIFVRVPGEMCLIPSIESKPRGGRLRRINCLSPTRVAVLRTAAIRIITLHVSCFRCLTWYCLAKQSRRVDLARLQASLTNRRFRVVTSAAAPRNSWG